MKQDLSAAFAYIRNSEYDVNWSQDRGAYASPNRKQRLSFTYLANGFCAERFSPSVGQDDWKITLRLKSYGVRDVVARSAPAKASVNGHSVRFTTPEVVYDYSNSPGGMRQNFIIPHKPKEGRLRLELGAELRGVQMAVDKSGAFVYFVGTEAKREVMRYTSLKVWDAEGRLLAARMQQVAADRFAIAVDDQGARYPVVVDPLNLDTAVVGPQAGEKFGFSVAAAPGYGSTGTDLDNGYIIVGAPDFAVGSSSNVGKVFVFSEGSNGAIDTPAAWTAVGTQASEQLGWSVAVSHGDATLNDDSYPDIVIGAPGYVNSIGGSVFVWYGDGSSSGWGSSTSWSRSAPSSNDESFGFSVAVVTGILTDGGSRYLDSLVVGDPYYTYVLQGTNYPSAGAAYAYYGSSSGLPSTASWSVTGTRTGWEVGYSVAGIKFMLGTDGTTQNTYADVFVGAPGNNTVYVYTSNGTSLSSTPAFSPSKSGNFGWSVAGIPDTNNNSDAAFAVGAPGYAVGGNANVGQVWVYKSLQASNYQQFTPDSSANAGSKFGFSVAGGDLTSSLLGDLIVGAPYENLGSSTAVGWVYAFYNSGSQSWGTTPDTQQDGQANAYLGYSVAYMPTVNFSIPIPGVLAGAPNDPGIGGSQNYGAVYVFYHH